VALLLLALPDATLLAVSSTPAAIRASCSLGLQQRTVHAVTMSWHLHHHVTSSVAGQAIAMTCEHSGEPPDKNEGE
jgi:hypothetical protein